MTTPIILHYHLFKNAGTSVDEILMANFGRRWRNHDTPDPAGSVFPDEAAAVLASEPHLVALSSHQLRPPLPSIDRPVVPIVFLRHPLDRIRSIYRFDRRRGPVTPAAVVAHEHDFPGYVKWMLSERPQFVSSGQAMLLTDAWDRATGQRLPIGAEAHFDRACAFLQQVPVVGVVEEYERSWDLLSQLLASVHPDFHASRTARHNVDGGREATLDDRLRAMRAELGDDLADELEEANRFDLRLHGWATHRLVATRG